VDALNALNQGALEKVFTPSKGGQVTRVDAEGDARKQQVLRGLLEDIRRYREEVPTEGDAGGHSAFRALMAKHEAVYSGTRPDLGKWGESPMAVPPPGWKGIEIQALQPDPEAALLAGPEAGLLSGSLEDIDTGCLYGDPGLYQNDEEWHKFVDILLGAGLVELGGGEGRETVRVFFVRKSDGKLRLVVDCRAVNAVCAPAPKTELGSVSALCDVAVPDGAELFFSFTDISISSTPSCFRSG